MPDAFRDVIAEIWRRLGLARPGFLGDDEASLTVDGRAITFALTADGRHIALSAKAGVLSENMARRGQQIAHLLRANLHTLLSSRACACLEAPDKNQPDVIVRALIPCGVRYADTVINTISDIAHLASEHSRALGDGDSPALNGDSLALNNENMAIGNGDCAGEHNGDDRAGEHNGGVHGRRNGDDAVNPGRPIAPSGLPSEGLSDDMLIFRL